MDKIRVLFLAASPSVSPLSLDQEIRAITAKIRAADHRDSLEVISKWAVRPEDLQQALLEHRPHVLHFSGHGTESEELVLLDSQGNPKTVSKAALANLLSVLKDNLRLVVLNACFSRPQAEAITQVIDCAVGMNRAVGDETASQHVRTDAEPTALRTSRGVAVALFQLRAANGSAPATPPMPRSRSSMLRALSSASHFLALTER